MRISLDLMSTPRLDKRVTNQDNPPELVCEMKWYLTMPCHFLQRTFTLVTSLYNYSYIYMLVTALNLPRLTAKIRARWPNATFQGQAPALGVCSRSAPQISGRFNFISLVSFVSFRRVFISEELAYDVSYMHFSEILQPWLSSELVYRSSDPPHVSDVGIFRLNLESLFLRVFSFSSIRNNEWHPSVSDASWSAQ